MTIRAAAHWLRHHLLELAALAAPTALALLVDPWFAILAVTLAAWWAGHEYRIHRRTPISPPPTTSTTTTDDTETEDRSEATA